MDEPEPGHRPDDTDGAEPVEDGRPAMVRDDPAGDDQREQRTDGYAARQQGDGSCPFVHRHPAAEQAVACRKGGRLAEPERDPRGDQHGEGRVGGPGGEHREQRPPDDGEPQHQLAAEAVGKPASDGHGEHVADEEGGEHQPLGGFRPAELRLHGDCRHGDVDAVNVADEDRGEAHADHRVALGCFGPVGGLHGSRDQGSCGKRLYITCGRLPAQPDRQRLYFDPSMMACQINPQRPGTRNFRHRLDLLFADQVVE